MIVFAWKLVQHWCWLLHMYYCLRTYAVTVFMMDLLGSAFRQSALCFWLKFVPIVDFIRNRCGWSWHANCSKKWCRWVFLFVFFKPARHTCWNGYIFCQCFFFILFFNGQLSRPSISKPNGLIFTKFLGLVDGWKILLTWYITLRSLKGCCHGNHLKKEKLAFLWTNLFVALPFRNGLQYCNSNFKRLSKMNFSTVCTILVTFGPVTPEFMLLTKTPFAAIWLKSAYHVKYVRISWTYFDLLYMFGRHMEGNIILILVWRSPKGHCYGN